MDLCVLRLWLDISKRNSFVCCQTLVVIRRTFQTVSRSSVFQFSNVASSGSTKTGSGLVLSTRWLELPGFPPFLVYECCDVIVDDVAKRHAGKRAYSLSSISWEIPGPAQSWGNISMFFFSAEKNGSYTVSEIAGQNLCTLVLSLNCTVMQWYFLCPHICTSPRHWDA